jgi:hypothetical protein
MTIRTLFEEEAKKLKVKKPTTRQLFEQQAEKLEAGRPAREKRAEAFRFFGFTPSPDTLEKIREQVKGKVVTPLVEAASTFAGIPGELGELAQRIFGVKEPIKTLPTGSDIKSALETFAGEEFVPKTPTEQTLSSLARLTGALAFPIGGEIQAGRALAGGLLGTGLQELAETGGAPQTLQDILSTVGAIAPFIAGRGGAIQPRRPTELRRIAEREAIEVPKSVVARKVPKKRLATAAETEITLRRVQKFEKSIEKAKDTILESVTPLAKTEGEAAQISKTVGKLFEGAEAKADLIKGPVSTTNIQNAIDKHIRRLGKSPVLATEEKSTLNFLNQLDEGLKAKNTTESLMAFNKSLNKEINFLKPTTGDKALLDVKDALMKDISEVGKFNPSFFKDWKKANALFTDFKKFTKIRETLSPIFTEQGINFGKFERMFSDVKKQKSLTKLLGNDQFKRLKDISKLGRAGEKVFKEITRDPRIFRQLERLSNIGIVLGLMRGNFKVAATFALEKPAVQLVRGYMGRVMTDPKFSKNYLNLLKAMKIGTPKAIITTAKRVNEDAEKVKKDIKD